MSQYQKNNKFNLWIKKILALQLLSATEIYNSIIKLFNEFKTNKILEAVNNIDKFFDYY